MSRAAASSASSSRGRLAPSLAALLLAAAALPSGCLYGGPELDSVVQELNANSRAVYDYFIAKGLTPVQAAGIVGNLMQESNCSPTAVQSGGPGRGIAQWSVGGRWDHDRNDNAVAFAAGRGASVWSLTLQLDFIWYELTTFSYYGLAQLRAATTVTAATVAFQSRFEGCGTCVQTQRIAYANQALAAYNTPSTPTWGATFVSQSFPYASAGAVSIVAGESARVTLTMRNSGSHTWDARTCVGTTQPRDRRSPFAGPEWPGPNRPACVPAGTTVASGASHTFTWTMHAPASPGRYDERWGMLEEGVAWFSDPGQGGPPDTNLEGIFVVTAAPPPVDAGHDSGVSVDAGSDSGASVDVVEDASDDAGAVSDAGATTDVGADDDAGATNDGGDAGAASDGGDAGAEGDAGEPADSAILVGGCSCRAAPTRTAGARVGALLALALAGLRRRRRTQR